MIKNVYRFSCHINYPLFLPDFKETWIFLTNFRKALRYQISWKSFQWEPSCSMRTDRRTAMTEPIVAFRNFMKAPKKGNLGGTSHSYVLLTRVTVRSTAAIHVCSALINDTCSCIFAAPYLLFVCKLSVLSYFCKFRLSGPVSVLQRGWWTLWRERSRVMVVVLAAEVTWHSAVSYLIFLIHLPFSLQQQPFIIECDFVLQSRSTTSQHKMRYVNVLRFRALSKSHHEAIYVALYERVGKRELY